MSGLGSSLFCTPPESMREVLVIARFDLTYGDKVRGAQHPKPS
ncbi:hypothetical protein HaLaN_28108, partial [Haematococcus lacustris]